MNHFKYLIIIFLLAQLMMSCTKVIDLKLGNNAGLLVIEGNITNIKGPQYIKLSENVPFTNTNTYPPVTGATVTVSDSKGSNYQFTEVSPGLYSSSYLASKAGNSYTMTVITGGKTYTANSVMPAAVVLDSLTSKPGDFDRKNNQRRMVVHYKDPPGVPNQYRFVLYVNGRQAKSNFAYNDDFIDGRYVNLELFTNGIDIFPGDTAKVEFQCIDKPVYTYWFTLMQQQQNGPGGGITPSNPPTNITPATLGYFSAHTTQTETVIVK